jgi:menaquinone-9 beta-reductase
MFIGDVASFFDPFTGQGIYLALHSATLAAAVAHRTLCSGALSADSLRSYCLAHRQAFRNKYRPSAIIQLGLRVPWLANRVIDCLARRPALADIVVGVAGAFVSLKAVLSWRFATQVFM